MLYRALTLQSSTLPEGWDLAMSQAGMRRGRCCHLLERIGSVDTDSAAGTHRYPIARQPTLHLLLRVSGTPTELFRIWRSCFAVGVQNGRKCLTEILTVGVMASVLDVRANGAANAK